MSFPSRSHALPRALYLGALAFSITTAASAEEKMFEFGAGILGGGGVVGLTKPNDLTLGTVGNVTLIDNSYPGFFGGTGGLGVMLDARVKGAVGVEVDFYYSLRDRGSGDITVGSTPTTVGTKYVVNIGQTALHVPILLKGTLPFGSVRPFLAVGPDIVLPSAGTVEITPTPPQGSSTFGATASTYILWTAAIGAEIRLPVPKLDIRIPFSIRAARNFSVSDKVTERGTILGNNRVYKTEWELQGLFTLGAAIYF
jgi:hypothetical protein